MEEKGDVLPGCAPGGLPTPVSEGATTAAVAAQRLAAGARKSA
eukprot:gene23036-44139_t